MSDNVVPLPNTNGDHNSDAEPKTTGWLSDAKVSERLAAELRGTYCYNKVFGWMRWDGKKWAEAIVEEVVEESRKFAKRLVAEAAETGDSDLVTKCARRLTSGAINAAANLARGQLYVDPTLFDQQHDLLNVNNGVVDLRTGELTDHDPALYFTRCAPTDYYPDATHPDWDATLAALPNDVHEWVQARLGQGITGYTVPDDLAIFMYGNGSNGKSTLIVAVMFALGECATFCPERVLLANNNDHPTELMTLRGARIAFMEELPEGRHLNAKRLKDAVGTAQMSARYCGRDTVQWTTTHSLFVSTNYYPQVGETDGGTWRRLGLLRFPYRYVRREQDITGPNDRLGDPNLRERMKLSPGKQHEAVLRYLVDGAKMWYANNLVMPDTPERVEADSLDWRKKSDAIVRWFDERLEPHDDYYITSAEMFAAFDDWQTANGGMRWNTNTFSSRFGAHDHVIANGIRATKLSAATAKIGSYRPLLKQPPLPEQFRCWVGVKFVEEYDDSTESEDDQGK